MPSIRAAIGSLLTAPDEGFRKIFPRPHRAPDLARDLPADQRADQLRLRAAAVAHVVSADNCSLRYHWDAVIVPSGATSCRACRAAPQRRDLMASGTRQSLVDAARDGATVPGWRLAGEGV